MKTLLLCAFLLFAGITSAQITITSADFQSQLAVGNSITSHLDNTTTSVDIGSTGNFGTLDFSGLASSSTYTSTSKDYSSSPFASDFSQAQYALNSNEQYNGSNADNWVYVSLGSSYLIYGTGITTKVSGADATVKISYSPAEEEFKLPITYNDTLSGDYTQTISTTIMGSTFPVNNTLNIGQKVNGYGKIKTPDGKTLDCLRIRTVRSITTQGGNNTGISYTFVTKTGESVTVVTDNSQPDHGTVQPSSISWTGGNATAIETADNSIPESYSLSQNYPNPFNPSTIINFSIPKSSYVTLKIYNVLGKEVGSLVNKRLNPGTYKYNFDAKGLTSGIYIYRIQAGTYSATKKMILLK